MVDETKICSSAEDGTTTDEDRDVRVDSGGSDEEELCMDEEDEDDVSPTSAAPGALTFGISRLLATAGSGRHRDGELDLSSKRSESSCATGVTAATVSGPAEALASLYAASHHAAVFGLHHQLHQQHQHHMQQVAAAAHHAAATAASAGKPACTAADDKQQPPAQYHLQYSAAAGVIKVPAHRPHPSNGGGPLPSPWATAAIDPVSFMQRNAFLFAADKNRLAAGKLYSYIVNIEFTI